ncbi:MAG: AAA family ATPase [Defluviicoccus sp.]|nr:AAA family ATPase [Defluviicoccus sp.]
MTGAGSEGGAMNGFPTRAPVELEDRPRERQWLVDTLWGEQAVGIVGGQPKCGKSILAMDLAVAVAAGVPSLRRFAPSRPGPVLMFAAEDDGHLVRTRLQSIAKAAGARFETLDIAVIDVPRLRLDHLDDRSRLQQTVQRIAPRLLILDPLVRLHGGDENAVADVAPILGFLRDIQRRFETAVLLVHHPKGRSEAEEPRSGLTRRRPADTPPALHRNDPAIREIRPPVARNNPGISPSNNVRDNTRCTSRPPPATQARPLSDLPSPPPTGSGRKSRRKRPLDRSDQSAGIEL